MIGEVNFLIENQKYNNAVNRIYYGVFYSLSTLGLLYKYQTLKHMQLIGWFNHNFIKPGILGKELGITVRKLFESRQKGDYGPFIIFTESDVRDLFSKMQDFVAAIEKYIVDNQLSTLENS